MFKDYLYSITTSFETEAIFDKLEDSLVADHSKWVYVDGEEGDYGIVTYTLNGELVCTHHIHGGDCENYVFTRFGVILIKKALMELIDTL